MAARNSRGRRCRHCLPVALKDRLLSLRRRRDGKQSAGRVAESREGECDNSSHAAPVTSPRISVVRAATRSIKAASAAPVISAIRTRPQKTSAPPSSAAI